MKIAQREDFALIFMAYLAKNYTDSYISISKIAKEIDLSPLFLKHIANSLKVKKLIKSKEGVDGGYRLAKKPQETKISEIIAAISKAVVTPACVQGVCRLKNKKCTCFSFWDKVNGKLFSYLQKVSLAEFAKL